MATNGSDNANKVRMHRLIDLCLEVVVKNLDLATSLEPLPDEILQKLLVLCRRDKVFGAHTRKLFRNCKMTKLDLRHQDGDSPEVASEWLDVTQGDIQKHLQHLDLSNSKSLTDADIESLQHLQQLTNLTLSGCEQFTGAALSKLHKLPLQRLVLEGCKNLLVEHTLNQLAHTSTLTSLDISDCNLTDDNIQSIKQLKGLVFLDISNNKQLTGAALEHVSGLALLRELLMEHSPRVVGGLQHLKNLKSLATLSLSHCEVQDDDIRWLEAITWLESLTLIGAHITDKGVDSIAKLTGLTALDLSMCRGISDAGARVLRKLPNIKNLNLNYCIKLTDAGVASLTNLGCLTSLGIIGCDRLLIQGLHKANHRPLVLLAEDSPVQAKVITMVLNRHNFDVELATNGQMALDMYRANPSYEIIVMDIMMPIMDGLTSTMRIRQHEREFGLKRTPIIIQTADAGNSHIQTCLAAGCDDFMTKPLDKSLVDKASKLIESSSSAAQQQQNSPPPSGATN